MPIYVRTFWYNLLKEINIIEFKGEFPYFDFYRSRGKVVESLKRGRSFGNIL